LVSYLMENNIAVVLAAELATPIGPIIREFFEKRTPFSSLLKTLLFATDRAILLEDIIIPSIAQGKIVIADRYYYSALVYRQAEKFDILYVRDVNRIFPRPDLTLLIDIDPAESEKRGLLSGKKTYYDKESLSTVREAYLKIAAEENFVVIDGMCNIEQLKLRVRNSLKERLKL